MQPVVMLRNRPRFKANKIVEYLLDHGGLDMNRLAAVSSRANFTQADWEQFYQLIGYSIEGYHELSLVSDETALAASKAAREQLKIPDDQIIGCREQSCELHCGVAKEE